MFAVRRNFLFSFLSSLRLGTVVCTYMCVYVCVCCSRIRVRVCRSFRQRPPFPTSLGEFHFSQQHRSFLTVYFLSTSRCSSERDDGIAGLNNIVKICHSTPATRSSILYPEGNLLFADGRLRITMRVRVLNAIQCLFQVGRNHWCCGYVSLGSGEDPIAIVI